MSAGYRFLLIIYNLIILAITGSVLSIMIGQVKITPYLEYAMNNTQSRMLIILISVIVILLALIGIVKALSGESKRKDSFPIGGSSVGDISITIPAIIVIINKAVKSIQGVREVKPKVRFGKDGLIINLYMLINPEFNMPSMSMDVQNAVKEHLDRIGGVTVSSISVLIDNYSPNEKTNR